MVLRQHCELVRANLVCNVAVGGNTICTDDDDVHFLLLHQQAGRTYLRHQSGI
jgi:hypothetical protein